MAITTTLSNKIKYEIFSGNVNFSSDVFKLALMSGEYTFDRDADDTYTLISGEEYATAGGYTKGGLTLTGLSFTRNNTTDKAVVTWSNPSWTASGEIIGPVRGALLYDDTHSEKAVIGFTDFGEAINVSVGSILQIQSITVEI